MRLASWVLHGQKTFLTYCWYATNMYSWGDVFHPFHNLSFSSYFDFTLELMNAMFYKIKRKSGLSVGCCLLLRVSCSVLWFIDDLLIKLSFYECLLCNVLVNYDCGIIRISKSKLSCCQHQVPYSRLYKLRLACFLLHFSLWFIIKCRQFKWKEIRQQNPCFLIKSCFKSRIL